MTRPRPCAGCGTKPIAYAGRQYCYDCVPRVWKRPPRCKRCGSETDYYTAGRCRRCHRSAAYVDSCLDCLAWGVTRHNKWLCQACRGWRARFGSPEQCASCRRHLVVNARGYCRLCSRQAQLLRPAHRSIDVRAANRAGQQLFIADTFRQRRSPAGAPRKFTTAWPGQYPVAHRQQILFDAERDLLAGRARGFPDPPLPDLAAALDRAVDDHAARHGWRDSLTGATRHGIQVLLALQDTPGAPVSFSEARLLSQLRSHSVQPAVEVLATVGMLDDDRQAPLESWFARQATGLAEPMAAELRQWFVVLRDGSTAPPRSNPRTQATIRAYVAAVIPPLRAWTGAGHQSLREITRDDIAALAVRDAHHHRQTVAGLRSLFRLLKARRVVFVNPAARTSPGPVTTTQPLPLDTTALRAALDNTDPAKAALTALIAFHAPRVGHLRQARITDVRDGRMFLPGQTILLAAPVRQRLSLWLDERARRWPNTINPHLFINRYTAVRTCPVSHAWIASTLDIPATAIREDRILNEAIAGAADLRRLCDLFGLSIDAAMRYAHTTGTPEPGISSRT